MKIGFERAHRWLVCGLASAGLTVAPATLAFPTTTQLAQTPAFRNIVVPANVVLVLDNSTSMLTGSLPPRFDSQTENLLREFGYFNAADCTDPSYDCGRLSLEYVNAVGGSREIFITFDRLQQSDVMLAQWFNPLAPAAVGNALSFPPWSYDGVAFPSFNPTVAGAEPDLGSGFIAGATPHDPRFKGPNYQVATNRVSGGAVTYDSNAASSFSRAVTQTGANAVNFNNDGTVGASLFAGAAIVDAQGRVRNQSLFLRPLTRPPTVSTCDYNGPPFTTPVTTVQQNFCAVLASPPTPTANTWRVFCPATNVSRTETASAPPNPTAICGYTYGGEGNQPVFETWTPVNPQCSSGTLFNNQCCATISQRPVNVGGERCSGTSTNAELVCCTASSPPIPLGSRLVCPVQTPPISDATCQSNGPNYWYQRDDAPTLARAVSSLSASSYGPANARRRRIGAIVYEFNRSDFPDSFYSNGAQAFANWYTYYRNRLFASVAATAQSLSRLGTDDQGVENLRLGYGAINYFSGGIDPYQAANPWAPLAASSPKFTAFPSVDKANPVAAGFVENDGVIARGVRSFGIGSDSRRETFNWLFSLRAVGATPNREALDSVGLYYSRSDNAGPYGDEPGSASSGQQVSCRRNFMLLVTDGEWTNQQSLVSGVVTQPLLSDSNRTAPPAGVADAATSTRLNALSTLTAPRIAGDGQQSSKTFPPATGQPQFATVTGSPTGTFSDVAYFWWSRDLRPGTLAEGGLPNNIVPTATNEAFWQNLTTYVVGLGVTAPTDTTTTRSAIAAKTTIAWPGVDTSQNVTQDTQCAGTSGCGRRDDTFRGAMASRGDFFTANSATSIATQLNAAFGAMTVDPGGGTGIAVRQPGLVSGDRVYVAGFETVTWNGDLTAYDAEDWIAAAAAGTGATPTPVWRASANLPLPANRKLFTSIKKRNTKTGEAREFKTVGDGTAGTLPNGNRRNDFYQNPPSLDDLAQGTYRDFYTRFNFQEVVDYLRGDRSNEQPSGTRRRRVGLIGDIVNSSPLYSKAPNFGYGPDRAPAAAAGVGAGAYPAFVRNKFDNRRAAVYVGANDGFMHAFAADSGVELFAYMPRGGQNAAIRFSNVNYVHSYSADGPLVQGDVYWNDSWRTVLVGTTGAGGSHVDPRDGQGSIYALDVTNPENFGTANVLWDVTRFDHNDLGYIVTPGVVGSALNGRWYYFVGNGYESLNDKAKLLAIDMQTGEVNAISTDNEGGSNPADPDLTKRLNGLGGVAPVYDANRNVVAIYAGDRLGRMWKFDLSELTTGSTPRDDNVTVTKLFVASRGTGTAEVRQPITVAPWVGPHPYGGRYIVFGTGKLYDSADRTDTAVQTVYALWERDPDNPATIAKSSLQQLTLSAVDSSSLRQLTGTGNVSFAGSSPDLGWYFDVGLTPGERFVVSFADDGTGFIGATSYSPVASGDPCLGGGTSFRYRLPVAGVFSDPAFTCPTCTSAVVVAVQVGGTVAPLVRLLPPASSSVPATRTLTGIELTKLLQDRTSGAPCDAVSTGQSLGGGSIGGGAQAACYSAVLRAWRDLPPGFQ